MIYWPAQSIIFWQDYPSLLFKLALQLEQAGQPFVNRLGDHQPGWQTKREKQKQSRRQTAVYTDMVRTV